MTLLELYALIQKLLEEGKEMEQVLISEQVMVGEEVKTIIRDLMVSDINFEKGLDMSAAFLQTQFNKGLVIGFIPQVD